MTESIEMKDICGTPFEIGDKVATDVIVDRSSGLRIGVVTAFDGKYVKVSYELKNCWDGKIRKVSVSRLPAGVVKVAV